MFLTKGSKLMRYDLKKQFLSIKAQDTENASDYTKQILALIPYSH